MSRPFRFFLAVSLSSCALWLEAYVISSLPLWESVTNEQINTFMMYSMAFAFIPLMLAGLLVFAALALAVALAATPGMLLWTLTNPVGDTARRTDASKPRGVRDA